VKRRRPEAASASRYLHEDAPLLDAAKEHKLLLQYCKDTNQYQWFPRPVSIYSGKRNLEWREASGKGTLYTWTDTLVPWPGHEDRVPTSVHSSIWKKGVRILANLVNSDRAKLRDGHRSSFPGKS